TRLKTLTPGLKTLTPGPSPVSTRERGGGAAGSGDPRRAGGEERTARESLPTLPHSSLLAPHSLSYEVIVVDDGSSDDTGATLARLFGDWAELRIVRHERNQGRGAAIRTGCAA